MLFPSGVTWLDLLSYVYPAVYIVAEGFIHLEIPWPNFPSKYSGMTGIIPSASSSSSDEYWKKTGTSSYSCSIHRNSYRSGNRFDFRAIRNFISVMLSIVSCVMNKSLKVLCSLWIQLSKNLACFVISLWAILLAVLDIAKSVSAVLGENRYWIPNG